ncbi:hypothetical protein GCM10027456_59810 [Kineosporia babensis]
MVERAQPCPTGASSVAGWVRTSLVRAQWNKAWNVTLLCWISHQPSGKEAVGNPNERAHPVLIPNRLS